MGDKSNSGKARRPRVVPKGVYCVEGDLWNKMHRQSSVRPALEVLRQWDPYYIPHVYRDVATRAEFDHYISKWGQKGAIRFPILYLSFHGDDGVLFIGDARKGENTVELDELAEQLEGRCHNRIIHFGACGTVNVHGHTLNRFLRTTGALAVCGYRSTVYWLDATAFEILIFGAMQLNTMTKTGAQAMKRRIENQSPGMAKRLGFRMVVRR